MHRSPNCVVFLIFAALTALLIYQLAGIYAPPPVREPKDDSGLWKSIMGTFALLACLLHNLVESRSRVVNEENHVGSYLELSLRIFLWEGKVVDVSHQQRQQLYIDSIGG